MAANKKPPAAVASAAGEEHTRRKPGQALRQTVGILPAVAGRRLQLSGRGNPCPICGRTKDGDCRWRDDWIACHSGAAANNLQPGQTIEVDGQRWYLSRVGGGHSGGAHIYKPDRPDRRPRDGVRSAETALVDAVMVRVCRRLHAELRPRVADALRLPPWEDCNPDQLRHAADLLVAVNAAAIENISRLQQARRLHPALAWLLPVAEHWRRSLGYQLADLRGFQRDCLGMQEGWR